MGVGEFKSNTWRPTSAILDVEDRKEVFTKGLPKTFKSAPCEWYSWENDIRDLPNFKILLSVSPKSFPLGTGPKTNEIWHEGYFTIAWTNQDYKMVYFNMGHNDMDYEGGTNKTLPSSFSSKCQNKIILQSLLFLGKD